MKMPLVMRDFHGHLRHDYPREVARANFLWFGQAGGGGAYRAKRGDAPRLTPSMRSALQDLGLKRIAVIYPGSRRYELSEQVEAVPLRCLASPGVLFGGG